MVNTIIKQNFEKNGRYKLKEPILGKLVKISIFMKNWHPEVKVFIFTEEEEILADDYLQKEVTNFYPLNFMPKGDFTDYFYSSGNILIEIEGLDDKSQIDMIKIFYE